MDNGDVCNSTQLIDGDGNFNATAVDKFLKEVNFAKCGVLYATVSIMGPQSSGKSTLLNNLFKTNFKEMDAYEGRSQTTKGIWLAKCVGIEPCTLVMDVEGTDGSERGEDDTAFEKQSALFALAASNIVLLNIWCHDIGREHAANKPLLKTVFRVMMQFFNPRKITLMFVIRDKSRTPLEKLENALRKDMHKIWDSIPKPQAHKNTLLSEIFNVQVVALSSYEEKPELFKDQVADLRGRFFNSIAPGGLAGDRRDVVPASGFAFSAEQIWKVVKKNRDLDLPAHKVLVANVRCEEIAEERCNKFAQNQDWLLLKEASQSGLVPGFGRKLKSIIGSCLSDYDAEAIYFDEGARTSKRKHMEEKLLQLVQPAIRSILGHLSSGVLKKFKEAFQKTLDVGDRFSDAAYRCKQSALRAFDEGCADSVVEQENWDTPKVRSELLRDLDEHITKVRAAKLDELASTYEAKLNETLSGPVKALLDTADSETWPSIRERVRHESQSAVFGLTSDLSGFDLDAPTRDKMVAKLESYANGVVEAKAKEVAGEVLIRMKDRFRTVFSRDPYSLPRIWTGMENLQAITMSARTWSLDLLSVLCAIRLDDQSDDIDKTLSFALLENNPNTLASNTWEKVALSKTLITPVQCKSLWRQFMEDTSYDIELAERTGRQAKAAQGADIQKWLPTGLQTASLGVNVASFRYNMRAKEQAKEMAKNSSGPSTGLNEPVGEMAKSSSKHSTGLNEPVGEMVNSSSEPSADLSEQITEAATSSWEHIADLSEPITEAAKSSWEIALEIIQALPF